MNEWYDWVALAFTTVLGWFTFSHRALLAEDRQELLDFKKRTVDKQSSHVERIISIEHILNAETATRQVALNTISSSLGKLEAQHEDLRKDLIAIKVALGVDN